MLANDSAVPFHKYTCASCHAVPGYEIWLEANQSGGLHVIHTSKRIGRWEPFYISTNDVPYFDERVDWEGRCDKMVQVMIRKINISKNNNEVRKKKNTQLI